MAVTNKSPWPLAVAAILMVSGPMALTRAASPAERQDGLQAINHLVVIDRGRMHWSAGGWSNAGGTVDAQVNDLGPVLTGHDPTGR